MLLMFKAGISRESHEYALGKLIIKDNELKVAVREGFIHLKEIQLPGKRKMKSKELLNGYHFESEAKVL